MYNVKTHALFCAGLTCIIVVYRQAEGVLISNLVLQDVLIRFYSDNESEKIVNTEYCNRFN